MLARQERVAAAADMRTTMKRVFAMTLLVAAVGVSTSALAESFDFKCVAGAGFTC
jgi:hypothetical protein